MLRIYRGKKELKQSEDILNLENFQKVFKTTLKEIGRDIDFDVNLYFVGPKTIRSLNRENRNIDKCTDVLSFPYLDIKPEDEVSEESFKDYKSFETGKIMLGEIFICTMRAKKQAKEYGHSINRELCFLLTHGLLHINGYDHIEEDDRNLMENMQTKILNKCKITRE